MQPKRQGSGATPSQNFSKETVRKPKRARTERPVWGPYDEGKKLGGEGKAAEVLPNHEPKKALKKGKRPNLGAAPVNDPGGQNESGVNPKWRVSLKEKRKRGNRKIQSRPVVDSW